MQCLFFYVGMSTDTKLVVNLSKKKRKKGPISRICGITGSARHIKYSKLKRKSIKKSEICIKKYRYRNKNNLFADYFVYIN